MQDHSPELIPESGILTLSDAVWKEAHRRMAVIKPLANLEVVSNLRAAEAGKQLGLSKRTIYTLISRYRDSGGSLVSLAPLHSKGGKGGKRLPENVEKIISSTIDRMYLSRQRNKVETIIKEIHNRCRMEKLRPPARNTIRARISHLRPEVAVQAREGCNAAHRLQAAAGSFPEVSSPLEIIQIDHTPVDIIVVDSSLRKPIGRPWITIGIDVFSRCITGYCLTLEPPSAVSVGLCLSHSAIDKQAWLERLDVKNEWPVHGKPNKIYVDNGKEFHSEALHRGCDAHGIKISYRPVGASHFGGIVERVIGTFMQMVHTLPGTTFSNVAERGSYDSEGKSALTLAELERWFALAISGPYHGSVHNGIDEPPIVRWLRGISEKGAPVSVTNSKAFLVD
ncbi:MAG: DDE-type integrase/transposase/recombinase, partial [Desulfobacteraceae bacterium]